MASFVEPDGKKEMTGARPSGADRQAKRRKNTEKVLIDRTVHHPSLPQTHHQSEASTGAYTFVVGADPQLGMRNSNRDWDIEMEYSEKAVTFINNMVNKPAFVCMCGDLVDMEEMAYTGTFGTREECLAVQDQQYSDFNRIFSRLDADIPLLCLCGNHDVGNRPTLESITRFTDMFGDDYFAFWCNHSYHICLNTNLHNDPSGAPDLYAAQHQWLRERLQYARDQNAHRIFLFGHHPWFLHDEHEILEDMKGENVLPHRDEVIAIPDKYFSIQPSIRYPVLDLCKEFGVNACFAGHFHQNNISYTSWGMPMVVTGGICNYNLESTAKDLSRPENLTPGAGVRVVEVSADPPPSTSPSTYNKKGADEDGGCSTSDNKNANDCNVKGEHKTHFLGCTHRYELV